MTRKKPELKLLLHDEYVIALDKPPGIAVAESPSAFKAAVNAALSRENQPRAGTLAPSHRIDKHASGVVLLARTPVAEQSLHQQFEEGQATCVFEALVLGYVTQQAGEIETPLVYDKRAGKVRPHPQRGRAARTTFTILERLAGHTLLECIPVPGLVHQVRVHLASAGHPLAVDPLYGGGEAVLLSSFKSRYRASARHEERPLIDRLSLHLAEVRFHHPVAGISMTVRSPRPRDLRATVTQLARQL